MQNRLSKILAQGGVASRRKCEELIFAGKVKVNGKVVTVPQTMVNISKDHIEVEGRKIRNIEEKVYFILNKPKGYLCSNTRISSTSKLVTDIFAGYPQRLFTVGRLDRDTTGLLLITNDGHFANTIMHPSYGITKEYLVKTLEEVKPEHLEWLRKGTVIEGIKIIPHRVTKVRRNTLKIIVGEGKKREVRILLERVGMTVVSLCRIRIGSLLLGTLPEGAYRELTPKERMAFSKKEAVMEKKTVATNE